MPENPILRSVVTRLVAALVVGGAAMTLCLAVLGYQADVDETEQRFRIHIEASARRLRAEMRDQPMNADRARLWLSDPAVQAVRWRNAGAAEPRVVGDWPRASDRLPISVLEPGGSRLDPAPGMEGPSRVVVRSGEDDISELLVSGDRPLVAVWQRTLRKAGMQSLLLAFATLLGLLMLRRWITQPLHGLIQLIQDEAGPTSFMAHAEAAPGEFRTLGVSLGGMLARLAATSEQLRRRERAFESLFQQAPAALLIVEPRGAIVQANRRAVELLGAENERRLVGRPVVDVARPTEPDRLHRLLSRLEVDGVASGELELEGERSRIVRVEASAERDDAGTLLRMRLALIDVTDARFLQRQLADNARLMNLVINHMSDGIVLIDGDGRIAAMNDQLGKLLRTRPAACLGRPYQPEVFWAPLGVLQRNAFFRRLSQLEGSDQRAVQERFEARAGAFLFHAIPVKDVAGEHVGMLWVVRDTTAAEQNRVLLQQRADQLMLVRRLAKQLLEVEELGDLMWRAADTIHGVLDVEALGLSLRDDRFARGRTRHMIHRGAGACLVEPSRGLLEALQSDLLPQVLRRRDVMCWSELPRQGWGAAARAAGLSAIAAAPLIVGGEARGMIWIARRGGEVIETHQIYLLETLAPVMTRHIEIAELWGRLRELEVTDPATRLPRRDGLEHLLGRHLAANRTVALVAVRIDASPDHVDQDLAVAARWIAARLRADARLARVDEQTLAIAVPALDQVSLDRTLARLNEPVEEGITAGTTIPGRLAVGAMLGPEADPGATLDALLARLAEEADQAGAAAA